MAGAPLGTRTAAKQSESKSKLMPNLFENRGLRRLWASHGQTGTYSESEDSLGHSGLLSPGLSRYRTSPFWAGIYFTGNGVYQDFKQVSVSFLHLFLRQN